MGDLSLLDMVTKLAAAEVAIHTNARRELDRVGAAIQSTAKAEFGHYQDGIGEFPAWEELAESTKEDRVRQGFTENDPLLRSGETRDSIERQTAELETVVGSNSEILERHEFGTSKMPPRPVLGPALVRNHDLILEKLGGAVVRGLVGQDTIHDSLGYNAVVEGD